MKYAVIIVTYNRLNLLKECIECVNNQKIKFSNILVVNNNSNDGTESYLKNLSQDNLKVINSTKNLGGAGGYELAVKNLPKNYDYVLFIDDDAMLNDDFLLEIDKQVEDSVTAYSGTVITDQKIDSSHRRILNNSLLMLKKDVSLDEYNKPSFLYDISTFCGLMVAKEIVDKIGCPNGSYFIWYDDTEYSLRVRKYTKIKNINTAVINHKTKISYDSKLNWKSYYGYRNQIDMGRKFSTIPSIYLAYRYSYHVFRVAYFLLLSMIYRKNSYYRVCASLHKLVLKDSIHQKLGLCPKFLPGKKF